MGFLKMKTGKAQFVDAKRGAFLWLVYTGEEAGTPEDRKFVSMIDRFYLNWHTAPESYQQTRPAPQLWANPVKHRVEMGRLPYKD